MPAEAAPGRPEGTGKATTPPAPHLDAQPMASPSAAAKQSVRDDKFYGHRQMAEVAERMLMTYFSCKHDSMAATADASSVSSSGAPRLAHFVAYALYRTRLPTAVTYYALLLLKRLKTRYPVARGSSGHRLFIAAFMLASKMLCDDSYSNKSWTIVGQGLFTLTEINQMERELLSYLDLHLDVAPDELEQFAHELQEFGAPTTTLEELCAPRTSTTKKDTTTHTPATPSDPPRRSSGHRRRPSHRRCLSLRPDFWTQGNAPVPSMPHRAESEWNVSQRNRPVLRASMPAQRAATTASMHAAAVASVTSMTQSANHARQGSESSGFSDWSSFYTTNNASTLSMATPSSVSSARITPSTSLSDVAASPWNGVPAFPVLSPFAPPGVQQTQPMPGVAPVLYATKPEEAAAEMGPPLHTYPVYPMYYS